MKNLLLLVILITGWNLNAQKYNVQGFVQDQHNDALIGATVVILQASDSTMIGFSITNNDGKFLIYDVPLGNHLVQITYVGFGTFEKSIDVSGDQKKFELGIVQLSSDMNKLDEVVVKADFIPLSIKKDTVEYNADAFRVRPNANVEELLKQLPGIEVEDDGSITAQGEEVKTVTVDGKKFFGNDPEMATKNIPAEAVKKVQVFDKKSDKAEFSGVNDGNETKTINLELKEDKKQGIFGQTEVGYGTDGRYKSKLSLNKFGPQFQLAGIVSYNNINDQGFSTSEYMNLMGQSFGHGRRISFNGPVNFNGELANGNTTNINGGLNLSYEPSKIFRSTTSYFLTYVDQKTEDQQIREYTLLENNFIENNEGTNLSENLGHNIFVELEINPDSTQRIDIDGSYITNSFDILKNNTQRNTDLETTPLNNSIQDYNTDSNNDNLSIDLEYNKKLKKKGRLLTLAFDLGNVLTKDSSLIQQDNEFYEDGQILVNKLVQDQIGRQDDQSYSGMINYTEPLGKDNYLGLIYEYRNYNNGKTKDFYDIDEQTSTREVNDLLSSVTNNDIIYNQAGLEYTIDKEAFRLNIKGMYNVSNFNGSIASEPTIKNTYTYFLPSVSFFHTKTKLRFNYTSSVNEPRANQLQTIQDNTNPTEIYIGNANLKPEYVHRFTGRYYFFNSFNLNSLFAYFSYNYTNDKIVNAVTFEGRNSRRTEPVNIDKHHQLRGSFSYTTPIRKLRIKSRTRLGSSLSLSQNVVDGVYGDVTTVSPYLRQSIENLNNKVLSIQTYGELNYNQNRFEFDTENNSDYITQKYGTNITAKLPHSWFLDFDYSIRLFSQENFTDNNTIELMNASISKGFWNDKVTAKLTAFDLLNQNKGWQRSITDSYIEQSISNSIQRYFMLSVIYKISGF